MDNILFLGRGKSAYENIFVDLPHGLGDQIMCLPLFKSIKTKQPNTRITVFTPNSSSSALLELFPFIDEHKSIDIKFTYPGVSRFFLEHYFPLRKYIKINRFDLYLAPHYNPMRELFARVLRFPAVILNKEHAHKIKGVENVLEFMGIDVDYDYSLKNVPASGALKKLGLAKRRYIVLDLYPQHLQRDPRGWFCFDELIFRLKSEGFEVVLVGLNDKHIEEKGVADLVNKTSFAELLDVLQGAQLVVALDSGIFHFSYSLGTPVIGLFGPVDPASRMPKSKKNVHAIYTGICCSPCIKNRVDIECKNRDYPYECMHSISVDMVMNKILEVMKHDV